MADGRELEKSKTMPKGQNSQHLDRRRQLDPVDDSSWLEVESINSHAVFMGYLSMAVTGLGVLVLLWTTVVLLGGFVSMLQKKDFWSLTVITLVQTTGVFDVVVTEKLSSIQYAYSGLFNTLFNIRKLPDKETLALAYKRAVFIASLLQALVFTLILCPLAFLYMFGLLISAGISLWRLIEHDYSGTDTGDASNANLKPALDVLYALALAQGFLFCYREILGRAKMMVVKRVANEYELNGHEEILILNYLHDTKVGCAKNPTFARGRNLVTYAVDLIKSQESSPRRCYLSGVSILDRIIRQQKSTDYYMMYWRDKLLGRHMLMKQLIGFTSSDNVLQKLVHTLDLRSPYGRETREHAARIVAYLAGDIHLDHFPGWIDCISSLLDTYDEYRVCQPCERDWQLETSGPDWCPEPFEYEDEYCDDSTLQKAYKELLLQGLKIFSKLAAREDNCRVISNDQALLSKLSAPVTADIVHHGIDHDEWSKVVVRSLRVMHKLASAPGEAGAKLRRHFSGDKKAISSMERILKCGECSAKLRGQAILTLELLSRGTSSSMDTVSREKIIKMLLDISTDDNKDSGEEMSIMRYSAAQALCTLCAETASSAAVIFKANDNVVDKLTKVLLDLDARDELDVLYRIVAAMILEHLCTHCTNDDAHLNILKKAMTDAMPQVLGEILRLTGKETQAGTEADQVGLSAPEVDIENQREEQQDIRQSNGSSRKNDLDEYLVAFLLSLSVTVCDNLISADQDLSHLFHPKDSRNGAFSLPRKLEEMIDRSCIMSNITFLRITKLTCKMFISMMNNRGSYIMEDLDNLINALSSASKIMSVRDVSMVFGSSNSPQRSAEALVIHGITNSKRTLASLVKEAQGLLDKKKAQELEVPAASYSNGNHIE